MVEKKRKSLVEWFKGDSSDSPPKPKPLSASRRAFQTFTKTDNNEHGIMFKPLSKDVSNDKKKKTQEQIELERIQNELIIKKDSDRIFGVNWSHFFFPGLPEHYSLRKKIFIARNNSFSGILWDIFQFFLIFVVSLLYVGSSYVYDNSEYVKISYLVELVITQFFVLDLLLNFYIKNDLWYFTEPLTIIDILTITPIYISFASGYSYSKISFLRCLRVLRVIRLSKTFKPARFLSGVNRQLLSLVLTLLCIIYLSAGIIQLVENSTNQALFECQYINSSTDWLPSCSPFSPDPKDASCDCIENICYPLYNIYDIANEPSTIRCTTMEFFDALYFVIITMSTVGYGDIKTTTMESKAIVILLIITTLIVIPMRISELQTLLSLSNPYQNPYIPLLNESHIIVCGHTTDKKKLEIFLKEFFHPDRNSNNNEYHAVILALDPPNEEIRSLLQVQLLESKCTYVVGSALSVTDLRRVHVESAKAIFFLCNSDTREENAHIQDAANIMRALSVTNFNTSISCLVQVLRPEDRKILYDSQIDVVLCLDEFKTALQARNSLCPGFSTFIENLFHSFGTVSSEIEKSMAPWYKEYLHGAGMELYFVPLDIVFLKAMRFKYSRIVEGIFVQFSTIVLGLCNTAKDAFVLNPTYREYNLNPREFHTKYCVALIVADDQHTAEVITSDLSDSAVISQIKNLLAEEEHSFTVSKKKKQLYSRSSILASKNLGVGGMAAYRYMDQSTNNISSDKDTFSDADEVDFNDKDNDIEGYIGLRQGHLYRNEDMKVETPTRKSIRDSIRRGRSDSDGTEKSIRDSIRRGRSDSDGTENKLRISDPFDVSKWRTSGSFDEEDKTSNDDSSNIGKLGGKSKEIENAGNITNHIIVTGSDANLVMFVEELRRPSCRGDSYHPIVIVCDVQPSKWKYLSSRFNDIHYITGKLIKMDVFERLNMDEAWSLVLLASRDGVVKVDEEHVNSATLFSYLKLEAHVPHNIFFTVELNSAANMSVLNATMMRRARLAIISTQNKILQNLNRKKVESVNQGAPVFINIRSSNKRGINSTKALPFSSPLLENSVSNFDDSTNYKSPITSPTKFLSNNFPSLSNLGKHNDSVKSLTNPINPEGSNSNHSFNDESISSKKGERRRSSVIFNGNGRFTTKRAVGDKPILVAGTNNRLANSQLTNFPELPNEESETVTELKIIDKKQSMFNKLGGSLKKMQSSANLLGGNRNQNNNSYESTNFVEKLANAINKNEIVKVLKADEELWDAMDSHHVLPVFASSRAIVPSSFESLLVQSFYMKLTPIIIQSFIKGSGGQTTRQVIIPPKLTGNSFKSVFRLFINHKVLCLCIYRDPQKALCAPLPYVYTSPPKDTILHHNDCLLVYGSESNILRAIEAAAVREEDE